MEPYFFDEVEAGEFDRLRAKYDALKARVKGLEHILYLGQYRTRLHVFEESGLWFGSCEEHNAKFAGYPSREAIRCDECEASFFAALDGVGKEE